MATLSYRTIFILVLAAVVGFYCFKTGVVLFPQQAPPSLLPVAGVQPMAVAIPQETQPAPIALQTFIEVTDSCSPYFEGACVNARTSPSTSSPAKLQLRAGAVLRSGGTVEAEGRTWHKIVFDEWLRYPERAGELYVAAEYVRTFEDIGAQNLTDETPRSYKRILIDRSDQTLYAYDGDTLFMQEKISTGLDLTPTPRGYFKIFRKTPSRYMQGPVPDISDDFYDLPGVPWDLYFTEQGGAIHGAYWHDRFGEQWSHGCVNLPPKKAQELYQWAELGTEVVVRD